MERSFGADFGAVRVHDGGLADELGAVAVARGDELHFAPGRFQPESTAGREVIGHELAHVVQQRQGRVSAPAQAKGLAENADPGLEAEADELGRRAAVGEVVSGGAVPARAAGPGVAQCLRDGMGAKVDIDNLPLDRARMYLGMLAHSPGGLIIEPGDQEALEFRIAILESALPPDDPALASPGDGMEVEDKKPPEVVEHKHEKETKDDTIGDVDIVALGLDVPLTPADREMLPSPASSPGRLNDTSQIRSFMDRGTGPLRDGSSVITEAFEYTAEDGVKSTRRRQTEVRIPFTTVRGHTKPRLQHCGYDGKPAKSSAKPKNCPKGTATPLSLLTKIAPSATGKTKAPQGKHTFAIDNTFDPNGLYEKGHLMPAASGAPQNAAITTPMTAHTNRTAAWKESELAIDRMLQVQHGTTGSHEPQGPEEECIARLMTTSRDSGRLAANNPALYFGYKKIQLCYDGADPRVASSFVVSLHDKNGRCFHLFPRISNAVTDVPARMPSAGLSELFKGASALLAQTDAQIAKQSKGSGPTEWGPLPWESGKPPTAYPESHVPRPHRPLDFLLGVGDIPPKFKAKLDTLREEAELDSDEETLLDKASKATVGRGRSFSASQRHLAELHVRHLNGGKFLSDLAPSRKPDLSGVPEPQRDVYIDSMGDQELGWGKGGLAPDADHHTTASNAGMNLFSNLLMVSHHQNERGAAHNKPAALTNPSLKRKRDEDPSVEAELKAARAPTATHGAHTVKHGFVRGKPKKLTRAVYDDLFAGEDAKPYTPDELAALSAALDLDEGKLSWTDTAKQNKQSMKSLFWT